jgi:hypothetical protein
MLENQDHNLLLIQLDQLLFNNQLQLHKLQHLKVQWLKT